MLLTKINNMVYLSRYKLFSLIIKLFFEKDEKYLKIRK